MTPISTSTTGRPTAAANTVKRTGHTSWLTTNHGHYDSILVGPRHTYLLLLLSTLTFTNGPTVTAITTTTPPLLVL